MGLSVENWEIIERTNGVDKIYAHTDWNIPLNLVYPRDIKRNEDFIMFIAVVDEE